MFLVPPSPELDSKALLLKTPHLVIAGYGEIELKLRVKRLACWLSFIVPKMLCRPLR